VVLLLDAVLQISKVQQGSPMLLRIVAVILVGANHFVISLVNACVASN
jgi:hypothetical protein